jgi:hypothetical protein
MSTHAYIGVENENGTISAIYCHFDGYPDGVGADLVENFNSLESAQALIADGDCRSPGDPYKNRAGEVWEDIKPRTHANLDEFMIGKRQAAGHYAYLFTDGEWTLVKGREVLVSLKDAFET